VTEASIRDGISEQLLAELKEDIAQRRISDGYALLDSRAALFEAFDASQPNAAALLGYLAQWVDIGYRDPALVKRLLGCYSQGCRSRLSLSEYVHLRMAEAMVAMSEEEADRAIGHLDVVLTLADDVNDWELVAIANYWKARCQRKKGEYDRALTHTVHGRDLALRCGQARMAAVMRVLESWILFQEGRSKEALRTLAEAQAVLRETDDAVTLGNIESTYGRILRREGRYGQALEHFAKSIELFRKSDPEHRNLARTLANMAHVQRLLAQQFRKKIDADAAHRRKSGSRGLAPAQPYREKMEQLRREALENLDQAARIYEIHPNHRGVGTVHLNRAYLYLDEGQLDLAMEEAGVAYNCGEEKQDFILMARARILQCTVANARVEEGIEERPNARSHAQAALDYARDAVEMATHTQNRRLLARVHTWHGLTLSNPFFNARDKAREAMHQASAYLEPGVHDHVWEDFQALKGRILAGADVNATLLAWSHGQVGDKTFQQLEEDFADIVIPEVWEQEGRRVSRVAKRLSISPKKVRRVLERLGLRGAGEPEAEDSE
jgi:tetratricopeptide (TPR) repeat protein